jgi:hypothetical protein
MGDHDNRVLGQVRANSRPRSLVREARTVETKRQAKYIDRRMDRRDLSFELPDPLIAFALPLDGLRPRP